MQPGVCVEPGQCVQPRCLTSHRESPLGYRHHGNDEPTRPLPILWS